MAPCPSAWDTAWIMVSSMDAPYSWVWPERAGDASLLNSMTQSSPSCVARHESAKASDPLPASESAYAPTVSLARLGK